MLQSRWHEDRIGQGKTSINHVDGFLDIFRNFCLKLYLPITKNSVCKCILINVPTWPQNDCFYPTKYHIHANKPPAVYKNFTLSRWWLVVYLNFFQFLPKNPKKRTFGQKKWWLIWILYWWWFNQEWRSICADTVTDTFIDDI